MSFILILIGAVLLALGFKGALKEKRILKYKPVNAQIFESRIIERKVNQLYVEVSYYDICVSVRYEVNGREFISESIVLDEKVTDEYKAKQELEKILDESKVYICYSSPSEVVIKVPKSKDLVHKYGGLISSGVLLTIFGLIIIGLG